MSAHEPIIYWSIRNTAMNKIGKMPTFTKHTAYQRRQTINKETGTNSYYYNYN